MGCDSEACNTCQALRKELDLAEKQLMKGRLKMEEATQLLVSQNREIHDLRDQLAALCLRSGTGHLN